MKHLKLLGLLLAVLTTVFSYGQAGAGGDGVIGGDSTASGVIRIVQAEPTIQAETSGRIMTGTTFITGSICAMAYPSLMLKAFIASPEGAI